MAFSAEWLALREEADAAARSPAPVSRVARELPTSGDLRVVDLGTGTGANIRYLAPRLEQAGQDWLAVDRDEALLASCVDRMGAWGTQSGWQVRLREEALDLEIPGRHCRVATQAVDIARVDRLRALCAGRHLVTASALLDLVTPRWIDEVASICHDSGACVLFALSYDGRVRCDPPEPEDEMICTLVNVHQRTDKGMGGAAGPDAASIMKTSLEAAGYDVEAAGADWRIGPESAALQLALIDGWAEAAGDVDPAYVASIAAWRDRRLLHVDAGRSTLVVGHVDLAGWIPRAD